VISADTHINISIQNAQLIIDFKGHRRMRQKQRDQIGSYCKNLGQGVYEQTRAIVEEVIKTGQIVDIF
jgi:hypothetical protein